MVAACATGTITTAWALHLGCSTRVIGLLGAMPFLVQLLQVPGAWLTSRFGSRRTALVTVALSRQSLLPLVALPFLAVDAATGRAILVLTCGAHHALGILCNNAWVTWAGQLVPAAVRGRYFGKRTAVCTVASAASTLAVGAALDRGAAARVGGEALAAITAIACAAGALSVALMARQAGGERSGQPWRVALVLRPFRDASALRFGWYLVAWNAAVGFSAPLFGLYVVRDLGGGFGLLALYGAASAAARTVSATAWGRIVDRHGAQPVLVWTTLGLALAPCAWLLAEAHGPRLLVAEAVVGGVLLAGHGVATFTLPLKLAPANDRSHYHAAFSTAAGVAFALAAACGGALAAGGGGALPSGGRLTSVQLTLVASISFRVVAATAAAAVVQGPLGARRVLKKREAAFAASSAPGRGPLS